MSVDPISEPTPRRRRRRRVLHYHTDGRLPVAAIVIRSGVPLSGE
jgi:hypothetical protein